MSRLSDALNIMLEYATKDAKENGHWENGDEKAFIFNDGIGILSLEDNQFKVKIIAGEPECVDYDLDLIEPIRGC